MFRWCQFCQATIEATEFRRHMAKHNPGRSKTVRMAQRKRSPVCEVCGSDQRLEVHHKNGNRDDNRTANLQTLCHEHHMVAEQAARKSTRTG